MSSTAQPYGLVPIVEDVGSIVPVAIAGGISSGYASAIGQGTPIAVNPSTGVLNVVSTGVIDGIFWGCEYMPSGSFLQVKSRNWPASATYVAGTMIAYILNDPNMKYKIQSSGSLAQTSLYNEYDTVNPSTVSNGFSVTAINTTAATSGNTKQLRVLNLFEIPGNAWGDTFTEVIVELVKWQRRSSVATV